MLGAMGLGLKAFASVFCFLFLGIHARGNRLSFIGIFLSAFYRFKIAPFVSLSVWAKRTARSLWGL